jgi:hypothetical protein
VANEDFDPRFGGPLGRLREYLHSQGVETTVISGRRSARDQQDMIDNAYAYHHGLPLPHPERGPVNVAAPLGSSPHQFGFGADLQASNPADQGKVIEATRRFGLQSGGARDPNHVQLAGWRTAMNQGSPADAPAPAAAAAFAEPPPRPLDPLALRAVKPMTDSAAPDYSQMIMDYARSIGLDPQKALAIAKAEGLNAWSSRNPSAQSNIVNKQGVREPSYGDFQLNMNTMGADALKAGVDPRDPAQRWAADKFALDRMKAGGAAPWTDPVARYYVANGGVMASGSGDVPEPSAYGYSHVAPTPSSTSTAAAPAAPTDAPPPTFLEAMQKGDVKGMLAAATKREGGKEGSSLLDKVGAGLKAATGQGKGGQPETPQLSYISAPDTSAALAGPSQQLFSQAMSAAATPLSWDSSTFGAGSAGQRMAAMQALNPGALMSSRQAPGLTLNSLSPFGNYDVG